MHANCPQAIGTLYGLELALLTHLAMFSQNSYAESVPMIFANNDVNPARS